MRVAVVGGGVAGLGVALALARDDHEVTIVERDDTPMPATPDDAFDHWERRGAPQVRHSHAFLARLRGLLVERAPDVRDALLAAGATELRFTDNLPPTLTDHDPRPGDDELVAIACRRTTFEWVMRRAVLAQPGVTLRHGVEAVALDATHDATPCVRGVRVRSVHGDRGATDLVTADLVVDARGPRSTSEHWLADIGARSVTEQLHESGIVYLSRFYRLAAGQDIPAMSGPVAGDLGYCKFAVFVGDNRTYSITFAVDTADDALRRPLAQPEPFEAGARAIPPIAPWRTDVDSEPITGVHVMAGLRNRYRPLVVDGEPLLHGFVAAGDASVCTNPLYGRGCSLAFVHAFGLADALRGAGDDARVFALDFAAFTERELVPWFRNAVLQDEESRALAASAAGNADDGTDAASAEDPRAFMREVFRDGLVPAMRTSPAVYRAFLRWFNLLAQPEALMADPEVVGAVLAAYQDRENRPPEPPIGPDRDAFAAAIA